MILYGMGYFTMHGTLQTRATELNPQARASAVSLFAFTFFLGQGTGPIAMGQAIRVTGYGPSFAGAGVGILLLALWIRHHISRPRSVERRPVQAL